MQELIRHPVLDSWFPYPSILGTRRRVPNCSRSELRDEARDQRADHLRELGLGHEFIRSSLHCRGAMFIQTETGGDDDGGGSCQSLDLFEKRNALHAGGKQAFKPTGSGVEIDFEARNVWVDGTPVELAAKEFDLLAYFIDHPRRACRRTELLAAVWSSDSGWQNESTVTEHVYRLRSKLETDPQNPKWLATVRAVGYRWEG